MSLRARIEEKLRGAFAPEVLEVIDESEKHRGHAGWRAGGETHFRIRVVAEDFAGMSRIERQRAVNRLLAQEFADGVHALAMELSPPGAASKG